MKHIDSVKKVVDSLTEDQIRAAVAEYAETPKHLFDEEWGQANRDRVKNREVVNSALDVIVVMKLMKVGADDAIAFMKQKDV